MEATITTPNQIKEMNDGSIKNYTKKYLRKVDSYLKLNTKLDDEDIANFRALNPTIDLLWKEMNLRKIELNDWIEKDAIKDLNKYQKLKNKILKW